MMRIGTCLAACISGLAVVATAAPSLAKEERHLVRHLPDGGIYLSTEMNADRERSLRECNAEVAPWNNRDYQGTQIVRYNGCMFERGQMP